MSMTYPQFLYNLLSKEFWPKGPSFGLPLKGAVLVEAV